MKAGKARNDKRNLDAVIDSCTSQLSELAEFVSKCPDYIFSAQSSVLGESSTIGKHVRHALDHYACILETVQQPGRPVKYDERKLNAQAVEMIVAQLEAINSSGESIGNEVQVVMMTDDVTRELHFAFHHAVHHDHAMRTIASQLGLKTTQESFGVAPATLYFRKLKTRLRGKLRPKPKGELRAKLKGKLKWTYSVLSDVTSKL